jgi:hypothetical protein
VAEQQQQRAQMVPGWQNRTYTIGDRTGHDPMQFPAIPQIYPPSANLPTPAPTTISNNYDCSDFVRHEREGIRLSAKQIHSHLRFDLISKILTEGYGKQDVVSDHLSGLRALQASLAHAHNGQGPSLQQLLVIAGHNIKGQSQSADALWAILRRYGSRTNTNYRLGVLNGGCSGPDTYEILVFEHADAAAVTIWIFTEDINAISPDHIHCWSAITRPNVENSYKPQSYASVAASVVDPSLLHANYSIPLRPSPKAVPAQPQFHPQEPQQKAHRNPPRRGHKAPGRQIHEHGNETFVCSTCKKSCRDLNTLQYGSAHSPQLTLTNLDQPS